MTIDIGRFGIWTMSLDTLPAHDAAATAAEIERLGYRALWIPEALGRDPLVAAPLYLGATQRLTVATGVATVYARDAFATAYAQRTLAEWFPGRFLLGLGVSHAPAVAMLRQRDYLPPLATMRAYLDRMDAATSTAVAPSVPPRRVLAALGPRMLELAAEKADGVHPYNVTPEHSARARAVLGPDKLLAPDQKVLLETDPEVARGIARQRLAGPLAMPNYVNNLRRLGFGDDDLGGGGSDRLVDALVAWGPVDQIVARLHEHLDAGADHVAINVLAADTTRPPLEQWRTLADALSLGASSAG